MNHAHRGRLAIALSTALLGTALETSAWSISGTVKDESGAALANVAVTVQDSAKYATTTNAQGVFSFSTVSLGDRLPGVTRLSAQVVGNDLLVSARQDGSIQLSLVDVSGRSLWADRVTAVQGEARVALPAGVRHKALFLRLQDANGVEIQPLSGSGALQSPSYASRAMAAYPVLKFKLNGYEDATYSMTAENATGVTVTMKKTGAVCDLPTGAMKWESSGILVSPKTDANHPIVAVKDPTIQRYNNQWLVYATTWAPSGTSATWNMEFLKFSDFSQAAAAPQTYMDQTPGFTGYKCAPELFYFEPQKLWYLTWQQQDPAYSTTATPDNPKSWSAPKKFYPNGMSGAPKLPIDYYPICDDLNCYLFFTGDDGKVYRAKTTLANFPNGFGAITTVITKGTDIIFEGSSHYKLKGLNKYLHLVEGMGSTGRYFSAWTSTTLDGAWQEYKVGQTNPFARSNQVTYASGAADWTNDISHGELLRDNPNQKHELDACKKFQLLYQGRDPNQNPAYERLPYRLGLLTQQ